MMLVGTNDLVLKKQVLILLNISMCEQIVSIKISLIFQIFQKLMILKTTRFNIIPLKQNI